MTTLVTGASGFVGGQLIRRLQREGYRVRAFARPVPSADALRQQGFEVSTGDIRDAQAIDRAMAGCDTVFHVAALYRSDNVADQEFRDVNVEGTRHVLDAAQRQGVRRVVHVSTAGVHGHIANPPADETYSFGPRDAYQQSKLDGELLAQRYFANGLAGAIVRPVGIYGPGDTRFLKLFKAIQRGYFVMLGDGQTLYHMTYIDDLVDGMLLCAQRPEAPGQAFIIGGGDVVTIGELARRIAQALGVSQPRWRMPLWPFEAAAPICQRVCRAISVEPPLYPRRLEFFTDDRAFSIDKAKRLLGYRPTIGLDEGIRRTIQWYREQGKL